MSYLESPSLALPSGPSPDLGVPGRTTASRQCAILLVEDEDFVREMTSEILESAGYRVLTARNAAEASASFFRYRRVVRLLLTDVVLPGQNGRDLAHELSGANSHLRTIFISGYPENAVTRHGIQDEGVCYLAKPFSAEALLQRVQDVLDEKWRPEV